MTLYLDISTRRDHDKIVRKLVFFLVRGFSGSVNFKLGVLIIKPPWYPIYTIYISPSTENI